MYKILNKKIKYISSICIVAMIAVILSPIFVLIPKTANAQTQVVSSFATVPVNTSLDYNTTMDHLKNFTLDRLATLVAKQILHQMTISVVNWINSGFEGSPAFLTNPEGFFLDAADQVTGAFLSEMGPLQNLCSPFSLDIRLALALNQVTLYDKRYTCTLGTIIGNSRGTMEGFTQGDFSQGGWPAFLSISTEPQNNPSGAFLIAQSNLNSEISSTQNSYRADLAMGSGFLSWKDCKDVTSAVNGGGQGVSDADGYRNSSNIQRSVDSNGKVSYKKCEVSTPGSVIANTLQTNLDVPVHELELADDINAVVNALVTQMITQMLSTGLKGLSSGSSGSYSYTDQVMQDVRRQTNTETTMAQQGAAATLGGNTGTLQDYKNTYDEALGKINQSLVKIQNARACLASKPSSNTLYSGPWGFQSHSQTSLTYIDSYIATNITPVLIDLNTKQSEAARKLASQNTLISPTGTANSSEQLRIQVDAYGQYVQNNFENITNNSVDMTTAIADLTNAGVKSAQFDAEALRLQTYCNSLPVETR
jgi:hypothetical protein